MFTILIFTLFIINCNPQIIADVATTPSPPPSVMIDSSTNEEMIRQCNCEEEFECTDEMKNQAIECLEPCWQKFEKVTQQPLKLKACFEGQRNFMGRFLNCFEQNIAGCTSLNTTNMIAKKDISNYFRGAVAKIKNAPNAFFGPLSNSIHQLLDTSALFAQCVNRCFLSKNSNGFCFDRKGCQPLLSDFKAKKSMKICVRKLNWKQQAGETCDCAVDSGLLSLKNYCPILKLMAKKVVRKSQHQNLIYK